MLVSISWDFIAFTVSLINGIGIVAVILFIICYQLSRLYKRRKARKLQQRFRIFWIRLLSGDLSSLDKNSFSVDELILLLPFCIKRKKHPNFERLIKCMRATGIIDHLLARLKTANMKKKLFYVDLLSYLHYEQVDELLLELAQAAATRPLMLRIQQLQIQYNLTFEAPRSASECWLELNCNAPESDVNHWLSTKSLETKQFKLAERPQPKFYPHKYNVKCQFELCFDGNINASQVTEKMPKEEITDCQFSVSLFNYKTPNPHQSGKNYVHLCD